MIIILFLGVGNLNFKVIRTISFKNKQIPKLHSYHSSFTNWLIGLSLVWSVFLFSGYVASDFSRLPTVSDIELVEIQSSTTAISIVQHYIGQLTLYKQTIPFYFCPKAALIAYNRLQQVQFIALKKKGYTFSFFSLYLPLKIIPTNLADSPSSAC